MALLKKIIIYTLGLLGLGIAVVIVSAGYLVLVPSGTIFDYHYVKGAMVSQDKTYTDGIAEYEKLVVESHGFDILLYPQDEHLDKAEITFSNNANGFTKEALTEFSYTYSYDTATKTIFITVLEPSDGLVFYSNAYIKIGMPDTSIAKDITIISAGGDIVLGESTPFGNLAPLILETTSITIENTRAQIALQNFKTSPTGTLSITNVSGRTDILSDVGTYEANGVKLGNVILKSEIGSFTFGTETIKTNIGGNLDIQAPNAFVEAGNVGGNVSQVGENGLLKLNKVHCDLYVNTENSEVEIDTVLENVVIISKFNTIKINHIGTSTNNLYSATINSTNGNIEIGDCYYSLNAISTRGNITVLNAYWDADIETTYGDVSINYSSTTLAIKDVLDEDSFKTLTITTTEGNITATNIKAITTLSVDAASTASVTAEFLQINGINTINLGRRESTIKVPVSNFTFNASTSSGGIDILAGDIYKKSWENSDFNSTTGKYSTGDVNMLEGSSVNKLNITSTVGKIIISTNEATQG